MPIINRIEYKGQGIRIISENIAGTVKFKYAIVHFPVGRNSVFKILQSLVTYEIQEEASKIAKEKITKEIESDNWERPKIPISKLLREQHNHED